MMEKQTVKAPALLLLMVIFVTLTACSTTQNKPALLLETGGTLALAPYTQPVTTRELMAGYIPEVTVPATLEDMAKLDENLVLLLESRNIAYSLLPGLEPLASSQTPLEAWVALGTQKNVDYILAPYVLYFRERQGGGAGVITPASVMLDFYFIDVQNGRLLRRSHFTEEQQSLSENILTIGTFFKRGGKWLSAQELAIDGADRALTEFGL